MCHHTHLHPHFDIISPNPPELHFVILRADKHRAVAWVTQIFPHVLVSPLPMTKALRP